MRTLLHILIRAEDELAHEIIAQQRTLPETQVDVIRLEGAADYESVVEKVFAADSVQVW